MNKHKLPVLGFSLLLLITSCKKNDVQYENKTNSATPVATISAKAADWAQVNNWTSSKGDKFTSYSATIADSSITTAVTGSGLVLAFAKSGETIKNLPFQEKGTTDAYWYYEVSTNALTLYCDAYSGTPSLNTSGFKYFVFTPEQLKDLAAKGHSRSDLMQLSYESVAALLNK
ncbi:MAG: hypothetical protein ACXVMS_18990 [Flavisolibacter sp.]